MSASKKQVAQAILRRDPLAFFEKSLSTIMRGVEYLPNWHLEVLAHELEEFLFGDTKRLVINIQPRMTKSLFCSVSFPMFALMKDPSTQIMCVSYSEVLATQFHQLSRLLSKQKWYRELNPALQFKTTGETSGVLKETDSIIQTSELGYRLAVSLRVCPERSCWIT